MDYVYSLKHSRLVEAPDIYSTILIGYFSSMDKVEEVIKHYQTLTGFEKYPNDFVVEKCAVDFDDFEFTEVE